MFNLRTKFNIARAFIAKNRPFYIQYYILSRCNLNCRQCNIVEGNSDLMDAGLPEIEKMAKNLRKIGAGVVLLTGGEPFLRKDIHEIVKILVDNGLDPRLQTAGFQTTRKQFELCREAGAKDINVSLDSLVPAKQEYINGGIPKSWHRAIECIMECNEVFDLPDRICAFGTVLSRFNFFEIPAIIELATYTGWYESLVPVHITNHENPMNFRGVDEDFKFIFPDDGQRLRELKDKIYKMKKEGHNVFDSKAYLDSCFYFLEHGKPNWRKNDVCDSPNLYFAILPNLDFAVCCDYRYQGRLNTANPDFPRIFRSPGFRKEVLKTTTACRGCNFGSYPEVSLSVRNYEAFFERAGQVLFQKKLPVPKRSLNEVYQFIEHLREKYEIPGYEAVKKPKPGAFSQRYGDPEYRSRGFQTDREAPVWRDVIPEKSIKQ